MATETETETEVTEPIEYKITIYPYGLQPFESDLPEKPAALYFDSKEDKENYVMVEFKACLLEWGDYQAALTKMQRYEAKVRLEERRVTFARMMGFDTKTKYPRHKYIWIRVPKEEPNDVA